MLDAAADLGQFVRAHGRIADNDQLVIVAISTQHVYSRTPFAVPAAVVLPDRFVYAVMKIEILQVFELGTRRRE